jgi:hypothetical protein
MCESRLSSLVTSGVLGKVTGDTSLRCMGCRLGKQILLPYSTSQTVSTRPFDLIQSDVWGPAPFFRRGIIVTMLSLLMISLASPGYIFWRLGLRCLLPIRLLLRWFAHSMTLPFMFFVPTLSESTSLVLFITFFLRRALFLSTRVSMLMLKTVLMSTCIVTLRPLALCCLPPLSLLSFGLKLSQLLFIL